ncbi:MAG: UbiD family decarboxylase, partial [Alphaproteobacteria bacterium]
MANRDLRDWIEGVRAAGELKVITGAEPKEEIGGIVDIYMRKMGNPAVLFDEVPGFPKGHRVIANILTSIPRVNLALGLPPETAEMQQIQWWRNYFKNAPSEPTKAVNGGPLLDNVFAGADVDIEKIPTPVWHEHDGGPYIGTGCLVAMKDPDSGWINYGCYRVQSHEPNVASVMMSPGKHGLIIMRKYHERGEPCPVAVVAGMHPVLVMLGGIEIPYGKNELEAAGGILGEPIEVINMPKTGLPVPANAEIAFEGLIHPDDRIKEGPLGEWTGYYASGSDLEPAIRIDTLMYRNDPILVGAIPAVPPNDNTFYFGSYRCGAVWNQLEAAGIPGVQGVWTHEAGGSRFMLVISIKTLYGGHSKQAAMVASHCHAGAYNNRWTIV